MVALTGRVGGSTSAQVQAQLKTLIDGGEKRILLDLAGTSYLTSAAFRVLLVAANQARLNSARFALCGVTDHVRDLFERGGLIESFTIFDSRDEALARLS